METIKVYRIKSFIKIINNDELYKYCLVNRKMLRGEDTTYAFEYFLNLNILITEFGMKLEQVASKHADNTTWGEDYRKLMQGVDTSNTQISPELKLKVETCIDKGYECINRFLENEDKEIKIKI